MDFLKLANIETLNSYFQGFYNFTGYTVEILDDKGERVFLSIGGEICKNCFFKIDKLRNIHLSNNKKFTKDCISKNKIIVVNCHDNFYKTYAPIIFNEKVISVITVGPVINSKIKALNEEIIIKNTNYYNELLSKLPKYKNEKLIKATEHLLTIIDNHLQTSTQTQLLIKNSYKLKEQIQKNINLQTELEEQNQKLTDYNERLVNLFTKNQENKKFYKTIFETTGSSTIIINKEGLIIDANKESLRVWGYSKEELINQAWVKFVDESEIEKLKKNQELRLAGKKEPFDSYLTKIKTKSGKVKNVLLYSRIIKDTQLLVISLVDIHEYIETQKQLRDSKQQYKILTNSINDCIFVLDKEGKYQYLNYAFEKITGYKRKDFIGKHFITKVHSKYQQPLIDSFKKSLINNETKYHRVEFYNNNNELIPIEINVSNLFDSEGNITGRIGIFRDIRKQLEYVNKIEETKQIYQAIVENMHDALYIYQNGEVVFINKQLTETLGFTLSDLSKDNIINIFETPADGAKMIKNANNRLKGLDIPDSFIINLKTKKGKIKPCQFSVKVIEYKGKKAVLGAIKDLSETKEKEKEILKLFAAIQNSPQPVIIANNKGVVQYVNKAVLKTLNYTEKELVNNKRVFFATAKHERDKIHNEIIPSVEKNGYWEGNITLLKKDGTEFPAHVIYSTFKNENLTENIIIHFNDISKQKKIEKEIIAAKEKAEESNRLKTAFMANMNHEIRTPMNAIIGFSNLMLEADYEQKDRFAKIINTSAQQLMSLINDIIELSTLQSDKNNKPVKQKIALNTLINDVFDIIKMSNSKGIPMFNNISVDEQNVIINTNPEKFKQIITNLLSNAIKYTKDGFVEISAKVKKNRLSLFIKDTGMGIPEKDLDKIFNTFYRAENVTKEAIRGTGLGLSIVKSICDILDIDISVQSKLNEGTTFKLEMDCEFNNSVTEKTKVNKIENTSEELPKHKILVAEDELSNFLFLEAILKKHKIAIDHAQNGKEAVKMALKNDYDLILMDIKMPEMDGIEASKIIRSTGEKTPIVAQSAFASEAKRNEASEAGINDYITKPIDPNELMQKIKKWA